MPAATAAPGSQVDFTGTDGYGTCHPAEQDGEHSVRHARILTQQSPPFPPSRARPQSEDPADLFGNPVAKMAVRCTPNW